MLHIFSFALGLGQGKDLPPDTYIIDVRDLPDPEGFGIAADGRSKILQKWIVDRVDNNRYIGILEEAVENITVDTPVAFGCYAGKNRSVAMAEIFYQMVLDNGGIVTVQHLGLEQIWGR